MEQRYQNTKILKTESNTRRIETTIPPTIDRQPQDIYFYSVQGDRLDLIADEYYGDASKWVILASANQLGRGTLHIEPGTQIRIPYDPDNSIMGKWLSDDKNR